MALIFMDGFDHYSTEQAAHKFNLKRNSMNQVLDQFTVLRHVRNADKNISGQPSNLGGVSLYFSVDHTRSLIQFSFAICDETDNFNQKVGGKIAEGRFKKGLQVQGAYDRTKSLVDNAITILDMYVEYVQDTGMPTVGNIPANQVETAFQRLNKYTKVLPRAEFTGTRPRRSEVTTTMTMTPIGEPVYVQPAWPFPRGTLVVDRNLEPKFS